MHRGTVAYRTQRSIALPSRLVSFRSLEGAGAASRVPGDALWGRANARGVWLVTRRDEDGRIWRRGENCRAPGNGSGVISVARKGQTEVPATALIEGLGRRVACVDTVLFARIRLSVA